MNLFDKDCDKIVEVEIYFLLLCKLYYSKEYYENKDIKFFIEFVIVLKEEILVFRVKDKIKYCVLVFFVFFNNDICVSDFLKDRDMEKKFNYILKFCGLLENILFLVIRDFFNFLKGCFVKIIGDKY